MSAQFFEQFMKIQLGKNNPHIRMYGGRLYYKVLYNNINLLCSKNFAHKNYSTHNIMTTNISEQHKQLTGGGEGTSISI